MRNLTEVLKENFGFDTFKGDQEAVIRNLLAGNDAFVLMPTGGGKSLCYQLPALVMEGTAIVISPLIALMKNQVDAMRNYSEEDGVAHFLNSSLSRPEIHAVKADVLSGKTEPTGLLPMQLPADMQTVEEQLEDVTRDMRCHVDSEGNTYDFAFGMNWKGVINDARTEKYK